MPPERTPVLQVVPYGAPARAALRDAIADVRGGDPLAPCTVVVPSALAGVTLRRALATELGGLAGVAFVSLPGLAEQLGTARLASAGRRRLDSRTAEALVAGALAADPGRFRATAEHPATVAALAQTIAELRPLDDRELDALAARSGRAADVVRIHRAVRRSASGWADDHDALVAARTAVQSRDAVVADVGPVILHLPRSLTRAELELVAALAAAGRLRVLVGRTGRPGADRAADELVANLGAAGLDAAGPDTPDAATVDPAGTTVVLAPDPAEEARHAVRLVLEAIAGGTAPERIAIVSRTRDPYALLAHEELTAAGVLHSAPSPARLSQSIAGRTLLGLLGWLPGGARRADLMRTLRAAPVLDADGRRTAADRWDRRARDAGVVGGLDQWRSRLTAAATDRAAHLASRGDDVADDRGLADLARLAAFVEHLAVVLDAGGRIGWGPLARWAKDVLRITLGRDHHAARWPEHEQAARQSVLDVLDGLGGLHDIGPEPDAARFLRTLEHELQQGGGRVGRFGHGVTVGRLVDAVGADLDLVVVLGGAEGTFPPRRADDALLPERERRTVGALRPRGSSREEEERDVWAVLAAAPARVLTVPAADPRSQREQHPAPWVVELASARAGRDLTAPELARGPHDGIVSDDISRGDIARDDIARDGIVTLASFEAWLADGGAPGTATERDLAELITSHRAGVDVAGLPFVAGTPLARGFAAARSRRDGRFDEWSGNVGPQPILTGELADHRSPTGLQDWAVCPARYFFSKVLRVRGLDDPADVESIDPRTRGTLVHAIMEEFVQRRLGEDPAATWDDDARAELAEIADDLESALRAQGLTGRAVLWQSEWQGLRRHLNRIVDHGIHAPELAGMVPVAVEHAFGFGPDEAPAVEIDLGDGRPLRFGGRIDRIDRSPDGRRLVVVDYKTASSFGYRSLGDDIVDRGTKLQLPIYALAAREAQPGADEVAAYYWFVSPRHRVELKGGVIDERAEARFRDVLGTVVGGIEEGLFPARPGKEDWRPGKGPGNESCRFCAFDRVCPGGRGERWEQVRAHGALARYVALAEDAPPEEDAGA